MSFITFPTATVNPEVPTVKDITPEEVQQKLNDITLIDVRRPNEFTGELSHIPSAKLITLDNLEENIESLPKDQTIVFICRSGRRSITASQIAEQNGFSHTYNMTGGMIRWNELNFDIA